VFSEIVKVKTVVDSASAKQMENTLNERFRRVAGRFGSGLKNVIRGSVVGLSLALINKLLNPIEHLEEKIKTLLGHGSDTRDLAERLGASSGEVEQLRNVAESFKVPADQFKEVVSKFAEAIEKTRDEISNPFKERSEEGLILAPFAREQNLAKSFKDFMTFLQKTQVGQGSDQPLTAHASRIFAAAHADKKELSEEDRNQLIASGEIRKRTGLETAHAFEKAVFGSQQFGAMRRFIDSDVDKRAAELKQPSIKELTGASDKLAGLADQKAFIEVQNKTTDLIESSHIVNSNMIKFMEESVRLENKRDQKDLQNFETLKKASLVLDELKGALTTLNNGILKVISIFGPVQRNMDDISKSRMVKGLWKDFGKGWK
jgi:hypothetical protein